MSTIRTTLLTSACAAALTLAGCQSTPLYPQQGGYQQPAYQQPGYQQPGYGAPAPTRAPVNVLEYGYVTNIEALQNAHRGSTGAGVVLGAVVGGLLGNQVGGGRGRTAATIAGAVGGAMAGNTIEQRMDGQNGQIYGYRITIRVDNGQYRVYDVTDTGGLRINDRVQVRNGEIARLN
ncbi:glycine zipper 2TM domain-containing protein [Allofranklinella schreckenbergeri]|uniref:Glycine zipper 2TM domain-containing protein n=1 Tax=Allofranklinella schreckenbergeri TaxID=1076744 RepID=A0A3M6QWX8_9BURK|nr:glycine zipper 2TM domain-containing protein [Allofranklinella schreckenbergeri]RMW97579.1 glycine zipper 2TM domain-containing protein [Allofranklinella schreckenbergeri]RMX00124.1 glycine zipper 2TM domain-containing protein [Allofranklinella schreckenbergeri]RMX07525.1 glycine zipper 2TM domain-containing protein [Allofranklinella schreckenbergeri]RRD42788.1 glycine zipper 2TM domain-containing protein [Comamonadaceae bacterium OH3737_COT-264]